MSPLLLMLKQTLYVRSRHIANCIYVLWISSVMFWCAYIFELYGLLISFVYLVSFWSLQVSFLGKTPTFSRRKYSFVKVLLQSDCFVEYSKWWQNKHDKRDKWCLLNFTDNYAINWTKGCDKLQLKIYWQPLYISISSSPSCIHIYFYFICSQKMLKNYDLDKKAIVTNYIQIVNR